MKSFYPILIFILSFALYIETLDHQFAAEDFHHIHSSTHIKTLNDIPKIFSSKTWPGNLYRPISSLTYALTYHYYKLDPLPYHLTNIVLYALCCLLVYLLLSNFLNSRYAVYISLLFVAHPIHTEVVSNISYRTESLCAFFGLAFIYCAQKTFEKNKLSTLFWTFIFLLLSLLSKESGFVFILILPLFYFFTKKKPLQLNTIILFLSFTIFTLLLYLALRFNALDSKLFLQLKDSSSFINNPLTFLDFTERFCFAFLLLGKYIALTIFPFILSSDYSFNKIALNWNTEMYSYLSIVLIFLAITSFTLHRKSKFSFFPILFFISFLLTSNIILPTEKIFGEHLAFVPSLGIIGFLTCLLSTMLELKVFKICMNLLLIVFSLKTILHAQVWYNNDSLFHYETKSYKKSTKMLSNYGFHLLNKEKFLDAEIQFKKSLDVYPKNSNAAFGYGKLFFLQEDMWKARNWLERTLEIHPEHKEALNLLGELEFKERNYDKAKLSYQKLLKIDHEHFEGQLGLFKTAIKIKDFSLAERLKIELEEKKAENQKVLDAVVEYGEVFK